MTQPLEFLLNVSYAQVVVFDRSLPRPFNQWTGRHVHQGFSWRTGSVAFRTMEESGQHLVVTRVAATDDEPTPGAARAMEVPFEVPPSGAIGIGGISDSVGIDIPSGMYQLRFEYDQRQERKLPVARMRFRRMEHPGCKIVSADAGLDLSEGLVLTAMPA